MALTLDDIETALGPTGWSFTREEGYISLPFTLDRYRNADGGRRVVVYLQPDKEGCCLVVAMPNLYSAKVRHPEALFGGLLETMYHTPYLRFGLDSDDGEIRGKTEVPLLGAPLTSEMVQRVVGTLLEVLEDVGPALDHAAREGFFVPPVEGAPEPPIDTLRAMLDELAAAEDDTARRRAAALRGLLTRAVQLPMPPEAL